MSAPPTQWNVTNEPYPPFFGKVGTGSSMNLQNKNSGLCNHANAPHFCMLTLGSLVGQPFHQRSETKHWAKQWRGLDVLISGIADWRPLPTDECHVGARSLHFLWLFNRWCKTREKKGKVRYNMAQIASALAVVNCFLIAYGFYYNLNICTFVGINTVWTAIL